MGWCAASLHRRVHDAFPAQSVTTLHARQPAALHSRGGGVGSAEPTRDARVMRALCRGAALRSCAALPSCAGRAKGTTHSAAGSEYSAQVQHGQTVAQLVGAMRRLKALFA